MSSGAIVLMPQIVSSFPYPSPPDSPAHPPVQWTAAEVKAWLKFCVEEFSLSPVCASRFDMNGKAMCLLTRTDFIERAPHAGDVLYNVFQRLRHQEGTHVMCHQQFQSPVILSSTVTNTKASSTIRQSFVPILPQPPRSAPCTTATATATIRTSSSSSSATTNSDCSHDDSKNILHVSTANNSIAPCVPVSMLSPASSERSPSDNDSSCHNDRNTPSHENMDVDLDFKQEDSMSCLSPSNEEGPATSDGCRLLWEFVYQLLLDPRFSNLVCWESEADLTFRINNQSGLAELWGQQKNKDNMTYEKLSRALRYYYKMNIIKKVAGRRLTYRFLQHPTKIRRGQRGARPHASRVMAANEASATNVTSFCAVNTSSSGKCEEVTAAASMPPASSPSFSSSVTTAQTTATCFSALSAPVLSSSVCNDSLSSRPLTPVISSSSSLPRISISLPSLYGAPPLTMLENEMSHSAAIFSPSISTGTDRAAAEEKKQTFLQNLKKEEDSLCGSKLHGQPNSDDKESFISLQAATSRSDDEHHTMKGKREKKEGHVKADYPYGICASVHLLQYPDDSSADGHRITCDRSSAEERFHNGSMESGIFYQERIGNDGKGLDINQGHENFAENYSQYAEQRSSNHKSEQELLLSDQFPDQAPARRSPIVYIELKSNEIQTAQSPKSISKHDIGQLFDYSIQRISDHHCQSSRDDEDIPNIPTRLAAERSQAYSIAYPSSRAITSVSRDSSKLSKCQRFQKEEADHNSSVYENSSANRLGEKSFRPVPHSETDQQEVGPNFFSYQERNSSISREPSPAPMTPERCPASGTPPYAAHQQVHESRYDYCYIEPEGQNSICNMFPAHQNNPSWRTYRSLSPFSVPLASSPLMFNQPLNPRPASQPSFNQHTLSRSKTFLKRCHPLNDFSQLAPPTSLESRIDQDRPKRNKTMDGRVYVKSNSASDLSGVHLARLIKMEEYEQEEPEDLSMKPRQPQAIVS
ncbi:transcription factor etv7 [Plakobranchus ocellatus]|uniref:Transcription factor etv7 n=1 Tax=Plakobranchus ocellatus TaxID=259542 RepID=A0AAV4DBV3_9GAST|nr:transcription factor etv7 [Plakobranchus ocellatus]